MPSATDRLRTRDEIAAFLGVPRRTLDSWAYRGGGPPFFKVGRHVRYRTEDVERWLEERRRYLTEGRLTVRSAGRRDLDPSPDGG